MYALLFSIFQAMISLESEVEYMISWTTFKEVTFPVWPIKGMVIMSSVLTLYTIIVKFAAVIT